MQSERKVIDLGSQDLDIEFLKAFRGKLLGSNTHGGGEKVEELIMFTAAGRPYLFKDLSELSLSVKELPNDVSYFYYTLLLGELRFSLYLDPDRPAKLVLEGPREKVIEREKIVKEAFPPSGPRVVLHGRFGHFIIWGTVLSAALVFLVAVTMATGQVRPLLVTWVIFISGMVGAYLSIARSRGFILTSTMSLGKRREPYLELVLNFIAVALGIVSVIIVAMLL